MYQFISVDATTFTPTGVVGKDVEDIIKDLITAAKGDKTKAEKGIVYIDEIDKIANGSMTRSSHNVKGVLGGETQASFLRLIEGDEIEISNKIMFSQPNKVNTKNILFICGGAFAGIEELIDKEEVSRTIGFITNSDDYIKEECAWDKLGTKEIIKYGIMPELIGRLPVILKLNPLQKNELVEILTKPKNAIIKQYQKLMEMDGIELNFSDDALELIAEMSITNNTGARGLRGTIENIMTKITFNLPQDDEYMRKCTVTADNIKHNILPDLQMML